MARFKRPDARPYRVAIPQRPDLEVAKIEGRSVAVGEVVKVEVAPGTWQRARVLGHDQGQVQLTLIESDRPE